MNIPKPNLPNIGSNFSARGRIEEKLKGGDDFTASKSSDSTEQDLNDLRMKKRYITKSDQLSENSWMGLGKKSIPKSAEASHYRMEGDAARTNELLANPAFSEGFESGTAYVDELVALTLDKEDPMTPAEMEGKIKGFIYDLSKELLK